MGKYTDALRKKLKRETEARKFAIKQVTKMFSIGPKMTGKSMFELVQADPRYKATTAMRTASKPMSPKQKAALRKAQAAAAKANRKRN